MAITASMPSCLKLSTCRLCRTASTVRGSAMERALQWLRCCTSATLAYDQQHNHNHTNCRHKVCMDHLVGQGSPMQLIQSHATHCEPADGCARIQQHEA